MATGLTSNDDDDDFEFISRSEITIKCNRDLYLRQGLQRFLNSSEHSDIEIICRDKRLKAHRVLLACQSSYFEAALSRTNNNGEAVERLEIDAELMKACIEFMYTGKTVISPSQLLGLTALADKLNIRQLYKHCKAEDLKGAVPDARNCLSLMCAAWDIDEEELMQRAKTLALAHFLKMVADPSFAGLCYSCVNELITDHRLTISAPEELLTAVSMWVNHDVNGRKQHLFHLLEQLPLKKMKPWAIQPHLMLPAFIQEPHCQTLLQDAMSEKNVGESSPVNGKSLKCEYGQRDEEKALVDKQVRVRKEKGLIGKQSQANADMEIARPYLIHIGYRQSLQQKASDDVGLTDLANNTCQTLTTLPATVSKFGDAACCVNGENIVISGLADSRKECWGFKISDNVWSRHGSLQNGREAHCMAVCEGAEYVLAGSVPGTVKKLVKTVEMYDSEGGVWKHAGDLMEDKCWISCSCVHQGLIIVFGVYEGDVDHVVQVYNAQQQRVISHIKLPHCEDDDVCGITAVAGSTIMIGSRNTYITPVSSLLQGDSSMVTTSARYVCPNIHCLMTVCVEDIVLFGGDPKAGNPDHFAYRAPSRDIIKNIGHGWQKDSRKWVPGKCRVWPGADTTALMDM